MRCPVANEALPASELIKTCTIYMRLIPGRQQRCLYWEAAFAGDHGCSPVPGTSLGSWASVTIKAILSWGLGHAQLDAWECWPRGRKRSVKRRLHLQLLQTMGLKR